MRSSVSIIYSSGTVTEILDVECRIDSVYDGKNLFNTIDIV